MITWIYVFECANSITYIGTTDRLFRRFNEHTNERGSKVTMKFKPQKLLALYIYEDTSTKKREALENEITKLIMFDKKSKWDTVKGGSFCGNVKKCPLKKDYIQTRPNCKCGFPAQLIIKNDNYQYFRCCRRGQWDLLIDKLDDIKIGMDQDCNFYMDIKDFHPLDDSIKCERCNKKYIMGKSSGWKLCDKCYDADNVLEITVCEKKIINTEKIIKKKDTKNKKHPAKKMGIKSFLHP